MTGTNRRGLLVGGLGLLTLVNYADLAGALRLGVTPHEVALVSMGWLGLWLVLPGVDRADVRDGAANLAILTSTGVLASFATSLLYPAADPHYRLYATPLGMAAQSLFGASFIPACLLVGLLLLWWLQDYWHLRRTTPEERVLGTESRHATDNTEPI